MCVSKRWIQAAALVVALAAGGVGEAWAATQYWLLQDVVFTDGRTANGSFGYDAAANQVTSWNIRVQGAPGILPFTYVPGNSTTWAGLIAEGLPEQHFRIIFYANEGSGGAERELRLSVVSEPVGAPPSIPLLTLASGGGHLSAECCSIPGRGISAGSIATVPFPPPVGLVDVIEFYHAGLGHYVMSADPPEIDALDSGYFAGWTRTSYSFKAYATGSSAGSTMNPVCRYFKWPVAGVTTHFFSASAKECWLVDHLFGPEWVIESDNMFQIDLPDTSTGACPGGTIPVYRLWNGLLPTNHRYTTSLAVRSTMIGLGWIPEGYGSLGVAMCAVGP